jgi:peptide deformylase
MSDNQLPSSLTSQEDQTELEIPEVLQFPDIRLRQHCAPVESGEFGTPQLYRWIEQLNRARQASRGIGIAGPQIGLMKRLIVIDIPAKDWIVFGPVDPVPMHALINPQILWSSAESTKAVETCLSICGYMGFVPRPLRIGVRAWTPDGELTEFEAESIYARCLQHEIDHLDGILYPDRVTDLRDIFRVQPVEAADPLLGCNPLL